MKSNSLASSQKVWKVIQTLLSKVFVDTLHTEIGSSDLVRLRKSPVGHPFRAILKNSIVKFQSGLFVSLDRTPTNMEITDQGGFELPSNYFTGYVGFRFSIIAEPSVKITSSLSQYNFVRPGFAISATNTLSTSTGRTTGGYNLDGNTSSAISGFIPICYISEGSSLFQILQNHVGLRMNMAHIDLITYSA